MRLSIQASVALACCLLFAACQTPETTTATSGSSTASCQSACDSRYDKCANDCQQRVDNNMCPTECVDALRSCQSRCGN